MAERADYPATAETLNESVRLTWELHLLVGRPCADIARAVLATRSLHDLGQTGDGHLTQEQAEAYIRIVKHWIDQAKDHR